MIYEYDITDTSDTKVSWNQSDLFPHVLPPTCYAATPTVCSAAYLLGGLGRLAWYCDDDGDGYHGYWLVVYPPL